MKRFKLSDVTCRGIKMATGMDVQNIIETDVFDIDSHIENRVGRKLTPSVNIGGLTSRGSVFLFFNRLFSREYIDSQIARIRP